jgi:hypothetical protein
MIFCMVISLATTLEPPKQIGFFRDLLRAGAHSNETYRDSSSVFVPQYAVHSAWKEMLRKVMPLNLTLMQPGSLSNRILDTSSWNLEWTLQSGLFALMLKHGANPNAAIYGESPSDSIPVWANFVLFSFCLPPKSSYQALYLQVLDCFIAAGADMSITLSRPGIGGSQPQNVTGLDLFLNHLSQTSTATSNQINHHLLFRVVGRLLSMAKATSIEIHDYWPTLQTALPPPIISSLERTFWGGGSEMGCCPSHASPQTQKRLLADDQDDRLRPKRFRYIQPDMEYGDVFAANPVQLPNNYGPCRSKSDRSAQLQSPRPVKSSAPQHIAVLRENADSGDMALGENHL